MSGTSFWEVHSILGGLFLCVMCAIMPRLTLFVLAVITGAISITFWGVVGWILIPRIVVASIATTIYWNTNPTLCFLAWMFAFVGEFAEKTAASSKRSSRN